MKIEIWNSQATQLYLTCGTADGVQWVPRALASGQQGYRQIDVPANTTWTVRTWPALSTVGTFAVSDAPNMVVVVNTDNTLSLFSAPSTVVGSAWQAQLPFTIPTWVRSDEGLAFLAGFFLIATVRITRAGLRWLSRTGEDLPSS